MAVDDDVDMVFLHDPEIRLGLQRIRRSEKNILKVGGQHGTAPAVGNGCTGPLLDEVFIILVNAHVGPVHDLHNLSVDVSWNNTGFLPFFIKRRRRPLCIEEFTFGLAPFI